MLMNVWLILIVHTCHVLDCDKIARRIVSAVRSKLDPISGDFMGATRQWEKNREQKLQQERKANS